MHLRESFKALLGAINPNGEDVKPAVKAHTDLREFLASDDGLAKVYSDSFLSGSYARETSIAPIKDLDVVVLTNYDRATTTPRVALNALRRALRKKYTGDDETVPNRRSILVDLPDTTLTMDVIPAIASGDRDQHIWVPDRALNEWIKSHPHGHITLATDRHQASSEIGDRHLYKSTVKLLRWWRHRQLQGLRHPKGFLIEILCYEWTPVYASEWAEAVLTTLDGIAAAYDAYRNASEPPEIADPAVPGEVLRTKMSARDFTRFLDRLDDGRAKLQKAIESEDNCESAQIYRELFGEEFPDCGTRDKKGGGGTPAALLYPRSERNVRNPPGFA